jgi:hypothetical protein
MIVERNQGEDIEVLSIEPRHRRRREKKAEREREQGQRTNGGPSEQRGQPARKDRPRDEQPATGERHGSPPNAKRKGKEVNRTEQTGEERGPEPEPEPESDQPQASSSQNSPGPSTSQPEERRPSPEPEARLGSEPARDGQSEQERGEQEASRHPSTRRRRHHPLNFTRSLRIPATLFRRRIRRSASPRSREGSPQPRPRASSSSSTAVNDTDRANRSEDDRAEHRSCASSTAPQSGEEGSRTREDN